MVCETGIPMSAGAAEVRTAGDGKTYRPQVHEKPSRCCRASVTAGLGSFW